MRFFVFCGRGRSRYPGESFGRGICRPGRFHLRGHFRPGNSPSRRLPNACSARNGSSPRSSLNEGVFGEGFHLAGIRHLAGTRPFIHGAKFRAAVAGIPEIHLNSAPSLHLRNRNPMRPERGKAFRIEFAEKPALCSQRKRKTKRA